MPRALSDEALVAELDELRRREREVLPDLLACLAEGERRRIHLDLGYATLFDYCVDRLRYSEGAAARRIHSARAADRFPALYVLIRDGVLSLTSVSRLAPHLTAENFDAVVSRAARKRQREIEELVVELAAERERPYIPPVFEPEPAEPDLFSDAARAGGSRSESISETEKPETMGVPHKVARPRRPDVVRLESPGVVRISFQADVELRGKLERARELLLRSCPSRRLEGILTHVLDDFLERRDPARRPASRARSPRRRQTRRIPRWVKDAVWSRDGGRCSFLAPDGRRCSARAPLEFDHVTPWACGGSSDDPANIRLLCRAHNLHSARKDFGAAVPSG